MAQHDPATSETPGTPTTSDSPATGGSPTTSDTPAPTTPTPARRKVPLPLKIFGALSVIAGVTMAVLLTLLVVGMVLLLQSNDPDANGLVNKVSATTLVIFGVETALMAVLSAMFAIFGFRLMRNKARHAAQITEVMIFVIVGIVLCDIMLDGLSETLIPYAVVLVFLIVMQSYLDPSLAQERELQRKLRDMETREAAEDGTLGRDESGKGYIALNFFNILILPRFS